MHSFRNVESSFVYQGRVGPGVAHQKEIFVFPWGSGGENYDLDCSLLIVGI